MTTVARQLLDDLAEEVQNLHSLQRRIEVLATKQWGPRQQAVSLINSAAEAVEGAIVCAKRFGEAVPHD